MPMNLFLIVGITPANHETEVSVDASIVVTFAMDMDRLTMTPSYFRLREANGSYVTVSVDYANRKATIRPSAPLNPGVQYELQIVGGQSGIRTITGDYMAADRWYDFTTASVDPISPPVSVSVSVSDGYPTVSWNPPSTSPSSLEYEVKISTSLLPPESDPGAVVWPSSSDVLSISSTTLAIPMKLQAGDYVAYVRAKNGKEASDWSFASFVVTEEPAPSVNPDPSSDWNDFYIADSYPKHQQFHITPDAIYLLFSLPVDPASVTTDSVYLVMAPGKETYNKIDLLTTYDHSKQVPAKVTVQDANVVVITPSQPLDSSTMYTVIVRETVQSSDGSSALGEVKGISFHTAFTPFFGDPEVVREKLKDILVVGDLLLYKTMHQISQYAYDIVSQQNDFNAADYEDGKAPYYVHEYVQCQAAYDLLLNGYMNKSMGAGKTVQLGDLMVQDNTSSLNVTSLLSALEQQLKTWEDLLHGHHNRGYAKPVYAVKGETGAAYPEFLTRTEFKEFGQ